MVQPSFSGREIATVLSRFGYVPVDRTGSHLKLRWESPDTDEVRVVSVPMKSEDEISRNTYRSIANQYGANDFQEWCRWIDRHR